MLPIGQVLCKILFTIFYVAYTVGSQLQFEIVYVFFCISTLYSTHSLTESTRCMIIFLEGHSTSNDKTNDKLQSLKYWLVLYELQIRTLKKAK